MKDLDWVKAAKKVLLLQLEKADVQGVGVGIGDDENGNPCIVALVTDQAPSDLRIPQEINGVPVKRKLVGKTETQ